VQVEGDSQRSFSASFELFGGTDQGALSLTSPLGSVIGRAEWHARGARLLTPEGRRFYGSVDELSEDLLGERVPMLALVDWMEGRPSTVATSQAEALEDGSGFRQSGWEVDTRRAQEGRVVARRRQPDPAVTLRVVLDPR
jgi:outer membrane lipoprotein LolB